jgi:hypothetical protein
MRFTEDNIEGNNVCKYDTHTHNILPTPATVTRVKIFVKRDTSLNEQVVPLDYLRCKQLSVTKVLRSM